jgi:Tol biopolymer transport system component
VAQARVHEQSTDPNQPQEDYEIFVMNADGSGVRQLTVNDVVDEAPTWSPDGRRIAFNSGFTPRPA